MLVAMSWLCARATAARVAFQVKAGQPFAVRWALVSVSTACSIAEIPLAGGVLEDELDEGEEVVGAAVVVRAVVAALAVTLAVVRGTAAVVDGAALLAAGDDVAGDGVGDAEVGSDEETAPPTGMASVGPGCAVRS